MLYMDKLRSYIDYNFATKSFKLYYLPYARIYLKTHAERFLPIFSLFRGFD